jgi:hypothetical protein
MAIAGSINAQVRLGVKTGYNLSGVMADYLGDEENPTTREKMGGDPRNFKLKSGFQFGMIADCPVNDAFAIQPGVRLSIQGFKDKYKNSQGKNEERETSLYYLQVPVYAQYRYNIGNETNFLFQAGPYFGYGLSGRHTFTRNDVLQTMLNSQKKISFGNDRDIQKYFDYGIGVGIGIEVINRVQLMLAYDYGLNRVPFYKDVKEVPYHIDMRNHTFSLTVGVLIGKKEKQRD